MSDDLVQQNGDVERYLSPELAELARYADDLARATLRTSSQVTYTALFKTYQRFCQHHHGLPPFAPQTVALYVADRTKALESRNTLRSRLAAIRHFAKDSGVADPMVDPDLAERIRGAFKTLRKDGPGVRRVARATYDVVQTLVAVVDTDASLDPLLRLRDRALVLFGFAVGRRGSELAGIDVAHIQQYEEGWLVAIPISKTNDTGEPEFVGVPRFPEDPLCPIAAVEAWMTAGRVMAGPVFRTLSPIKDRGGNRMRREDISRRLDAIATRAGVPGIFRSHSLRGGVVTSAEEFGVSRSRTRLLTGWKSDAMFSVYAIHRDKIKMSPLHDIYSAPLQRRLLHDQNTKSDT